METMEWKSSYSGGVPGIDNDHKRLIDIINRVEAAGGSRESVQGVLQELADYAREHFRREEEALRAADYPDLEKHVGEHGSFVDWLQMLRQTLGDTPTSQAHIATAVSNYLRTWLSNHILVTDMAYKDYLN